MKNKVLRVAIYIRVSTYDQARDGYSLMHRKRALLSGAITEGMKFIIYMLIAGYLEKILIIAQKCVNYYVMHKMVSLI